MDTEIMRRILLVLSPQRAAEYLERQEYLVQMEEAERMKWSKRRRNVLCCIIATEAIMLTCMIYWYIRNGHVMELLIWVVLSTLIIEWLYRHRKAIEAFCVTVLYIWFIRKR